MFNNRSTLIYSMFCLSFFSSRSSYSNGDLYEGFFQDGHRFGHGCYQSGRHNRASCTSIYVGEWNFNMRDGYGVQDDTLKGKGLRQCISQWICIAVNGFGALWIMCHVFKTFSSIFCFLFDSCIRWYLLVDIQWTTVNPEF